MKKISCVISFLLVMGAAFGQVPIGDIKAIIKREVANKRSKSIIVGIVDSSGRHIFAEGIISDAHPVAPDGNTLYEIGSITKVFTSLLLADMSVKQQLKLEDPISKYLPAWVKSPVKNGKEMSLLTLSTHRSGMPRFPYNVDPKNWDNPYVDYTEKQLYEYVSGFEPDVDFDTRWRYSNTAYGLLGNILCRVAGKNFEALVKQRICIPLQMNNTVITLNKKRLANMAIGHTEYGQPTVFTDLAVLDGAGALRSDVNDLLTFAEANLGMTATALYPAMELTHLEQAKKDGNDNLYTTMGWTLSKNNGHDLLYKDGGTAGYRTFLGIDKKNKIGVVVLSNSNNSVTDIGWHILDSSIKIETYGSPWALLDTLRATIKANGLNKALELYGQLKAGKDKRYVFKENQLNYLGLELRRAGNIKDAVSIFELNAREYPTSAGPLESLGETYKRNGDKKTAIGYFEKAAALEPGNQHWAYILQKLR